MIFDTGGSPPSKSSVLWVNENIDESSNLPSPAHVLALDISAYKILYVTVKYTDTVPCTGTTIVINDPSIKNQVVSATNGEHRAYRTVNIVENGLSFGNGECTNGMSGNPYAIPLYVYGAFGEA